MTEQAEGAAAARVLPGEPCILVCRECGDGDDAVPMPFESQAARGRWAADHTRNAGHGRWGVFGSLREVAASRERKEAAIAQAAQVESALHLLCLHPDFEYATTACPRKQWDSADQPPEGDGWERNTDRASPDGRERFDYHEESYWRRRKDRQ